MDGAVEMVEFANASSDMHRGESSSTQANHVAGWVRCRVPAAQLANLGLLDPSGWGPCLLGGLTLRLRLTV